MALGLEIGSCSCVCGSTIVKWDSSGARQWTLRRGPLQSGSGDQSDALLLLSGTDLYSAGSLVSGQDEGALNKYDLSIADSPSLSWQSDRNGMSESATSAVTFSAFVWPQRSPLIEASDGFIHRAGGLSNYRYDATTGQLIASATLGLCGKFLDGPSGDVFALYPLLESGSLRRLDTTLSSIASVDAGSFAILSDVVRIDASNLCVSRVQTFNSGPELFVVDHNLNLVRSYNGSPVYRLVNDGYVGYVSHATGLSRLDLSGITLDWTTTTMTLGAGTRILAFQGSVMAIDPGGNLYCVVEPTSGTDVSRLQRRDPADGSIVWEVDLGVSRMNTGTGVASASQLAIAVSDSLLVVIGGWFNGSLSTEPRTIGAFDPDTGALLWDDYHHGGSFGLPQGLFNVHLDADDNVYSCGYLA